MYLFFIIWNNTTMKITAYLPVFRNKLDKLRDYIKDEIKKPKKERSKESLKRFLAEAKELKQLVKELDKSESKKCPHCGEKL